MSIGRQFVSPDTASRLVNLDAPTRQGIENQLKDKKAPPELFKQAVDNIFTMVCALALCNRCSAAVAQTSNDVFRRFLASKEYKQMIEDPVQTTESYNTKRFRSYSFAVLRQEEEYDALDRFSKAIGGSGLPKKHRLKRKVVFTSVAQCN